MKCAAFTLIELLVVITIIVVLLALLTPALDKAIYQAELAVCAANLHGIATGAQNYAFNHKRRYPHRPQVMNGAASHCLRMVPINGALENTPGLLADDRPMIREYIGLELLNDPLNGRVTYDPIHPDSAIFNSYYLFFGTQWAEDGVIQGDMLRVGRRWRAVPDGQRYSVLASDHDVLNSDSVHGGHPDADGVMSLVVWDNEDAAGDMIIGQDARIYQVVSARWQNLDTFERGPLDMNYIFADGAVERYRRVVIHPDGTPDERMTQVPHKTSGNIDEWTHMPPK